MEVVTSEAVDEYRSAEINTCAHLGGDELINKAMRRLWDTIV